jgi:hypothetical protein
LENQDVKASVQTQVFVFASNDSQLVPRNLDPWPPSKVGLSCKRTLNKKSTIRSNNPIMPHK